MARCSHTMRAPLSIRLIAFVVCVAALTLGREFFVPIALALTFHALLRPLVRGLERLRIPAVAGAAIVVLSFLALGIAAGFALSGPVRGFMESAPASITKAREKLRQMGGPLQRVSAAASGDGAAAQRERADSVKTRQQEGQQKVPSFLTQLLGGATVVVSGLIEVLLLLYLMLAAGNLIFRKLVRVVPGPDEKRTVSDVFHETEAIVGRYMVVTALINVGQGVAVGLAMWAIGMPSPVMWGLLTFVMEFIPYLGGAINVALLLIIGFTHFDGSKVLLAPALYLIITTLQNNVVSPYAYGSRLKLSPLAVMICVLFWWFVWGIPGVFLAIPIAATLKVLGDQVPRFQPLGELLAE
jgi:predicted PurR-regulated permease PerM